MGKHKKKVERSSSEDGPGGSPLQGSDSEDLAEDSVEDTSPWGPCPLCGEWLAFHDSPAEDDLLGCIEVLKANLAAARAVPTYPQPPYVPLPNYPPTYPAPNTNPPPWLPYPCCPPVPMPVYPDTVTPMPQLPQTFC